MKRLVVVAFLAFALTLSGCGGSSTTNTAPATASGTWQAVLSGGSGEASTLSFVTTFTVSGAGSLSISGIEFITAGPCFVSGATASGSLEVTTGANGVVTGPLSFVVQSGVPAGDTLTLSGTDTGNQITGTWTLTGDASPGCDGSGQFVMCQGNGACTVTTT